VEIEKSGIRVIGKPCGSRDLQRFGEGFRFSARDFGGKTMQLKLSNRVVDGVFIVDCNGRIVFGEEASAIREFVKTALAQHKQIVLNLKNTTYIDSGGLGTMVGLYTSAHAAGGDVKLAQLTDRVGQLLQVTKLVTVFESFETEDAAVKSFSKTAKV
jgi:anti-sigma B factor antagonist